MPRPSSFGKLANTAIFGFLPLLFLSSALCCQKIRPDPPRMFTFFLPSGHPPLPLYLHSQNGLPGAPPPPLSPPSRLLSSPFLSRKNGWDCSFSTRRQEYISVSSFGFEKERLEKSGPRPLMQPSTVPPPSSRLMALFPLPGRQGFPYFPTRSSNRWFFAPAHPPGLVRPTVPFFPPLHEADPAFFPPFKPCPYNFPLSAQPDLRILAKQPNSRPYFRLFLLATGT